MNVVGETVGIAGARSTIAKEFCRLLPEGVVPWCDRLAEFNDNVTLTTINRYLVCTGFLAGKSLREIVNHEAEATFRYNFLMPAKFCDHLFAMNPNARVCLIGSESGYSGSYDMAYAGAKAALHLYVERKRLEHPGQQLVAIAPTVIWDSGMTQRRHDLINVERRFGATRHGRALSAVEVAAQAYQALFVATPFLSNTVIRMGPGL